MQIKHRTCFKCKYEAETAALICPRCRKRLRSRGEIRLLGGVLVMIGGLLLAMMSAISIGVYGIIFHPGNANGARFTGGESELMMIAGVFGFVFLFGFIAVIAGLWQLILGRRNMLLVWTIVGLGIIFIVGGQAFVYLFNR
jgi:hypothetical protein